MSSAETEVCEFCGRGFKTLNGLKIHCVKAHKVEMNLVSNGWALMEQHIDCDCMGCRPWTT